MSTNIFLRFRILRSRDGIGNTKRGKGTKWMVVDSQSIPLESHLASASPGEATLVEPTLTVIAVTRMGSGRPQKRPLRIIADRAYDSDPLRWELLQQGMLLICPHRRAVCKPSLNDGRTLRRYRKRWRLSAPLPGWATIDASLFATSAL